MDYLYNLDGSNISITAEYPIEKDKKIKKGQAVTLVSGSIHTAVTGPFIGVACENHDGAYDMLNPRANGEWISCVISPNAVYSCDGVSLIFNKSPNATMASFKGLPLGDYTAQDFVGGMFICTEKLPGSANTDYIGQIRKITDYDPEIEVFTVDAGGIIADKDSYVFIPPVGFKKFTLKSDSASLALGTNDNDLIVTGFDINTRKVFFKINNHYFK